MSATLTYRALAALLAYPDEELKAAAPEIAGALEAEALLPRGAIDALRRLAAELARDDLYALQERYVALFDRSRALSLNLFEHVHGESRDRGQAMVDLAALYDRHGLKVAHGELPDYLPAFLEFCSVMDAARARSQLAETASILRSIGTAVARSGSAYACVFEALLALAGEQPLAVRGGTSRDDAAEDLDREWAEEPVVFAGACAPQARSAPQSVRLYRKGLPT